MVLGDVDRKTGHGFNPEAENVPPEHRKPQALNYVNDVGGRLVVLAGTTFGTRNQSFLFPY